MKALLLALLLGALSGAPAHAADYPATVVRVIDGDTLVLDVAAWPDVTVRTTLRLAGVDTPESRGAGITACEIAAGRAAAEFTRKFVAEGVVTVATAGRDKYGRTLGTLAVNGHDLGAALIAAKLAVPYAGGKRKPWCDGNGGASP